MKGTNLRLLPIFLVLLYSSPAVAEFEINKSFEFYDISPKTKDDIKPEILKNTPIANENIKFHGSTLWQVEWRISWKKSNGICYLNFSYTKLNVLFKMPRISPNFNASDEVLGVFNKYYKVLLKHENGHMKNGTNALNDINKLLSNFNSYNDCQALNEGVKNAITKIVGKHKNRDIEYDIKTNHGELQGVSIRDFI